MLENTIGDGDISDEIVGDIEKYFEIDSEYI